MSGDPREELAAVLRAQRSGGSFATRRTAPVGDLAIEVNGVGPLRYPVTATQAKQLRLLARPAKYGHGEQTVLDRAVRDTWEVPRSRVKIEVLPVERGYRVALTYNLLLAGNTPATANLGDGAALAATAAALLEQHFTHTPERRWRNDHQVLEPPDRLVFLLDHQYTQRGLRWSQLKGDDAARADGLRIAADHAACDMALAHAEIHETYDCEEDTGPWRGRRDPGWDDELNDDEDDTDSEDEDNTDNVSLGELLDSSVAITPAPSSPISFDGEVADDELMTVTPSVELTPHTAEYTGFMGNWGNTMDRWYRRAAIVIWPRARAFAVKAKGDPLAAVHSLLGPTTTGPGVTPTRAEDVSTLLRFWPDAVRSGDHQTLMPPALRLAWELNDATLATRLIQPFTIEAVTPADANVLVALAQQHGLGWLDQQITTWMSRRTSATGSARTRHSWVETLPELCTNFRDDQHAPEIFRVGSARLVVSHVGDWLNTALGEAVTITTPSRRQAVQHDLGAATLAVLRAVAIAQDAELRKRIIHAVCDPVLRTAATRCVLDGVAVLSADELHEIGVIIIAQHGAATLQAELALPERARDDWSITSFGPGTCCQDCATLTGFLTDPAQQQLTWPLAKPRRQHIHQRIEQAELPVTHRTLRQGSPLKLVLTKTADLHTRDGKRRQGNQTSLRSLQKLLGSIAK